MASLYKRLEGIENAIAYGYEEWELILEVSRYGMEKYARNKLTGERDEKGYYFTALENDKRSRVSVVWSLAAREESIETGGYESA